MSYDLSRVFTVLVRVVEQLADRPCERHSPEGCVHKDNEHRYFDAERTCLTCRARWVLGRPITPGGAVGLNPAG